jgi:PKD repeat protein
MKDIVKCKKWLFVLLFFTLYSLSVMAQVTSNFTYTLNPASGCAPVSVNFRNTSIGAASYNWSFGNGNISVLPNPGTNYTAGTYTVTLTASNGGDSDIHTEVITIHSLPTADFTVNSATVCVGQTVSFADNSVAGSGNITTWAWDFGDGNTENNILGSTSHSYNASGLYPVSLIVTNTFGCLRSIVKQVRVLDGPLADFTGNPTIGCSVPANVTFANSSTTAGAATYQWNFGDGGSSVMQSPPAYAYNAFGTYSVSLIVTEQGCSDTLIRNDYVVLQDIVPDFTASATTVCLGQSIVFSDISNPLTASRTWDFGDGTTSLLDNPSKTYTVSGTYNVSMLNANGCGNSEIKNNYITVLPLPTINFSADDSTNCLAPFMVNFTNNSPTAVSWSWNFGDGSFSNQPNPSHLYNALGAYSVGLQVIDGNGCSNNYTKPNYIDISPVVADFTANPRQGCTPLNVGFTSTSQSSASPITSYLWDFGNGTINTGVPNTNRIYNADATYTVKLVVTTPSGCIDSITKVDYIRAGDKPIANFNVVDPLICHSDLAEFTDLSVGADSAFWVFDQNQGTFSTPLGAPMPFNPVQHAFPDTGTFYVRQVVFNNGCADSVQKNNVIRVMPPKSLFEFILNCNNPYSVDFVDMSEGADSIVWDFGDGSPVVSDALITTHVFASRGPKSISLTAFNFATGCFETVTNNITIAEPIANATYANDTSCYGVPVMFSNQSQDSQVVLWSFGDGSTSGANNPSYTYNLPGLYTSKLLITDINGCKDSLTTTINIQGPLPDFVADTLFGCRPFAVVFTDNTVSDSTLTNWLWNFGDGSPLAPAISATIAHTYTASGTYNVTMSVTDKNGCLKAVTKTNYIEVTYPAPSIVADTFACVGEQVLFNAAATQVSGPASFIWDFGDGSPLGSGALVSHSYSSGNTYTLSLTVTDKYGCDSTVYHILQIQNPTVAFTYSVITEGCGVSQIQFTDQTVGLSLSTWRWDFGDLGTAIQQNPAHTYTQPGYYLVSLTVTNAAGCVDINQIDSVFVQGPIGNFSFTPSRGCIPLLVTFTARSDNATSFTWDFGDGNTITSADTVVQHTYTQISTPTPSLILGNTLIDGSQCTFPAAPAGQITITSHVAITVDSLFDNICNGAANGSAYTTGNGGELPYLYNWSSMPPQATSSATGLPAGTYTVTLSDVNNCETNTVIPITEPPPIVTEGGAGDTLCPSDVLILSATASGGLAPYTYLWNPGNISNNGTLPISLGTSTTYTVIASDNNHCVGQQDTIQVLIYSLQPANVQLSSTSPICLGRSSDIEVQMSGLTGALTYQWTPNIGNGSGVYTVTPLQPTRYYVTITNVCDSIVDDSVDVLFNPQPTINFGTNAPGLCYLEEFNFSDNSVSGNPADPVTSWLWNFGDGNISTLKNPTHTYANAGDYDVTLAVSTDGGCFSNSNSTPFELKAYPYPISIFTVNSASYELPYEEMVCKNTSQGAINYEWNFGDGATSTLTNPKYTYKLLGNFTVELIAISQYGCKDTSTTKVETSADIIFPNAFTPNKYIQSGGAYNAKSLDNDIFFPYTAGVVEYRLEILNRWGEIVFSSSDVNIGWDGYYRGKLCELGVYVWRADGRFNNGKKFHLVGDVSLLW